ncbi:UTP--glucose-1-phosphate uridylyltransferase [Paenibacillus radicis (ex Gao et al. 2016)]|uniref:UTP--glucose-1-phosphate uridylyltransferase n=1 Tax=Paenibacillus radicis (ex Gao et al. 2016) TaxID=1737354 RepID=A0A917GVI2_9BACL|nr:UTP--glucose-1-phosphate uridylyltransferase [Paenibacillus radicis (ex Gao et al. 2016)]GGG58295.1 putative UTP--glucose-1-phosphate uridylyltransferase [Paenibacillus radicis (ex Gao et al. 2016)]
MVLKAVIPAAGYGTRNLPVTKSIPKEMFPIHDRPVIDYIVSEAINAGLKEILIILSRNKTEIMNYFDRSIELEWYLTKHHKSNLIQGIEPPKINIQYIRQPEALGLGHAIQMGKSFAGSDPFVVMLPDQLCLHQPPPLSNMIRLYKQYKSPIIGLHSVKEELLKNYGVVSGKQVQDEVYQIHSIIEKPIINPPSTLAIMGRYILTSDIFAALDHIEKDAAGEIQLTDALNRLCQKNPAYGYVFKEKWYDTSIESEYMKAQLYAYRMNKQNG